MQIDYSLLLCLIVNIHMYSNNQLNKIMNWLYNVLAIAVAVTANKQ